MMNWQRLFSTHRSGGAATEPAEAGRTPFHKDHDRIIFSSAFRRLDRKTQVHPLSENDHVHSRLTHSLEVSCVGRSLGLHVAERLSHKLPADISAPDVGALVQAACLAHDIGNPPYGHTGEDAIRHWFRNPGNAHLLEGLSDHEKADLQNYEGNAQGFRIVTQVECHRFDGGMRLTDATLGAFLKYPWSVAHVVDQGKKSGKFGCFQSELPLLRQLADNLGLLSRGQDIWCRHPLVYLMEAADDICYGLIDLEDGVEMGILRYGEVEEILRPLFGKNWAGLQPEFDQADTGRRRLSMIRGKAMDILVAEAGAAFLKQEDALLAGELTGDLTDHCSGCVRDTIAGAKSMARERIFRDPRKTAIEVGAYSTLDELLTSFLSAAKEMATEGRSTFRNSRVLEIMGRSAPDASWSLYDSYMRVLDYVAGMTDSYAAETARQFSGYTPPGR